MSFKKTVNTVLRNQLGIEIRRLTTRSSPVVQLVSSLSYHHIDAVFDVGANTGQFACEIRKRGFTGQIVSFEPLSSAHTKMRRISKRDSKWEVYPRIALGSKPGETEINISANSVSSSILPMLDSHSDAEPDSAYIGTEKVALKTLDGILPEYIEKYKRPFLKIDTQGFEWDVLDGAENILPDIQGVLLELSLLPLYAGQHLWEEVMARMKEAGFVLWALRPEFIDPENGRTLQADGIFYRPIE